MSFRPSEHHKPLDLPQPYWRPAIQPAETTIQPPNVVYPGDTTASEAEQPGLYPPAAAGEAEDNARMAQDRAAIVAGKLAAQQLAARVEQATGIRLSSDQQAKAVRPDRTRNVALDNVQADAPSSTSPPPAEAQADAPEPELSVQDSHSPQEPPEHTAEPAAEPTWRTMQSEFLEQLEACGKSVEALIPQSGASSRTWRHILFGPKPPKNPHDMAKVGSMLEALGFKPAEAAAKAQAFQDAVQSALAEVAPKPARESTVITSDANPQKSPKPSETRLAAIIDTLKQKGGNIAQYLPDKPVIDRETDQLLCNPNMTNRDIAIQTGLSITSIGTYRLLLVDTIESRIPKEPPRRPSTPMKEVVIEEPPTPQDTEVTPPQPSAAKEPPRRPSTPMKEVGSVLLQALQATDISTHNLAITANITDSVLNELLDGKQQWRPEPLRRVAQALQLPAETVDRLVMQHRAAYLVDAGAPVPSDTMDTLPARLHHHGIDPAKHLTEKQLAHYRLLVDPTVPSDKAQEHLGRGPKGLASIRTALLKKLNSVIQAKKMK